MDWEKVKGFCRRQTQAAKEKMNNAPHTTDPTFNQQVEDFVNLRNAATTTEQKMTLLQDHLNAANQIVQDLAGSLGQGHHNEEISFYAKKMEIFKNESANRITSLSTTFTTCIAELAKFKGEAGQLEMLLDDRRDKVLEYDFFKNKLDELRAAPPSDTSRIPRNEGRMNDWKNKYDDITNRTMAFMNNSRIGGESALLHAAVAVCNEYGRYLEEMGRAARAVLIADGNVFTNAGRQVAGYISAAATTVAPQAQQYVQQTAQQVAQQVQYASPTQQVPPQQQQQQQQQPQPAPQQSNRNKRDDPFAL